MEEAGRGSEWALLDQDWSMLPRVRIVNAAVSNISGVGQVQIYNAGDSSSPVEKAIFLCSQLCHVPLHT